MTEPELSEDERKVNATVEQLGGNGSAGVNTVTVAYAPSLDMYSILRRLIARRVPWITSTSTATV
jgi:hypothetical protein